MVQHTTVALIQAIITILVILTSASIQAYSFDRINKTTVDNPAVKTAKKSLLTAMIIQFIIGAMMIAATVALIVYKDMLQEQMSKIIYIALIASAVLLLASASLNTSIAVQLQCYRSDADIESVWKMSTINSVLGFGTVLLLLIIQAFIKKDTIKDLIRQYTHQKYMAQQAAKHQAHIAATSSN